MSCRNFAEVILPLSLPNLFTYAIPDTLISYCSVGKRVVVPFGKSKLYSAIVYNVTNVCPQGYEIKELIEVLDDNSIVSAFQLKFWDWIASYYMCCLGEVYRAAVPSGLKLESETILYRTQKEFSFSELKPKEALLLGAFSDNTKGISLANLEKITGSKNNISLVKNLINLGFIVADHLIEEKYKPKTEKVISLAENFVDESQLKDVFDKVEKKAPKQVNMLIFYVTKSGLKIENGRIIDRGEIRKSDLLKVPDMSVAALTSLIQKKVFIEEEQLVSRLDKYATSTDDYHQLTDEQSVAYSQILQQFEEKTTVLLHGATGSGKTEIYIKLIDECLQKGKQVLYLLPEIVLTSHIIKRLQRVFGEKCGIYHSKISDAERTEIWKYVADEESDKCRLVLGVRSSIFLPFSNLGLIIVDEEHETTYKQFEPSPRYNARDCSIVLASIHGAKVLLGSATPSFESYFNAKSGKYGLVELTKRFGQISLPKFLLSDTRMAMKKKQMHSLFTQEVIYLINSNIQNGKQSILFRNRRGFSPYVECATCGWIPVCENCDVSLTYHKKENRLVCHHCGYSIDMPNKCCACGDTALQTKGFGTEKTEDETKIFFPNAKIARIDSDTTTSRTHFEKVISDFENGQIDILVGTQMISKGFDFKNLSLAVVLNADSMLNFPDFRAEEHTFQLITQVGGRTGRADGCGKVVVQTSNPDLPIFNEILTNDYKRMYTRILAERNLFMYPPYSKLIKIELRHKDKSIVDNSATLLVNVLRKTFGGGVLGPEQPLIGRLQSFFIEEIMLKISRKHYSNESKKIIGEAVGYTKSMALKPGLIVSINVDPI